MGVATGAAAAATLDRYPRPVSTSRLLLTAALSVLVALVIETQIDPLAVGMFPTTAAAYILGVPPVLLASWVIVRSLRQSPASGGTIYAFDLAGAATGGIVGYVAIGTLGDQALYGLASGLCLVAAGLFAPASARLGLRRLSTVAAAVGLVVILALWGEVLTPPRAGPLKSTGADLAEGMTRDAARWDPLARIDVMRFGERGDPVHYSFLIDRDYPTAQRPPALAMELDMGALTPILGVASPSDLGVLDASILGVAYEVAPRPSVLVIGPGGGIDVLTALRHGAGSVTAVEVNRAVVDLMRGRYAAYGGAVYFDPRVRLVEDEARSFVRRSSDRYDLVVMTVVDSFAALSSGAYALTESYLYTEEAMADYLGHLAPGGALAIARWYRDPPAEIVRTFDIAVAGLAARGASDPRAHIAVMRYGNFGLLLIGERPYGQADVDRLASFASRHGFTLAYDPLHPSGPFSTSTEEAPSTDDRPFFFDTVPLTAVLAGRATAHGPHRGRALRGDARRTAARVRLPHGHPRGRCAGRRFGAVGLGGQRHRVGGRRDPCRGARARDRLHGTWRGRGGVLRLRCAHHYRPEPLPPPPRRARGHPRADRLRRASISQPANPDCLRRHRPGSAYPPG